MRVRVVELQPVELKREFEINETYLDFQLLV
jgi:hypothetical protein